jgi:hypothetical protein
VVNVTSRLLYPREINPLPIVYEAESVQVLVCTGAENLTPTGIRSPDRPGIESRYTERAIQLHPSGIYGENIDT